MNGLGEKNGMDRCETDESAGHPGCGFLLFDRNGSLLSWDPAMEQITGTGCTEVLGKTLWDILSGSADPGAQMPPERVKECISGVKGEQNPARSTEYRIRHPGSGLRDIELILFTLPGGGRIRGGAVVRDITGRKKAAEALRETNRKLAGISSTVRHDINNQLTILNGYLSLMEGGSTVMETGEIIRILESASDKIERILEFTREYEDVGSKPPAWHAVGEVVRMAGTMTGTASVRFSPDPSCDTAEVLADLLFVRVFCHLIDNSVRHGQSVSEIRVHCSIRDGLLQIVYEDNGAGIPDRARPTLFERGKGKNSYGLFLAREILSATGIAITETGEPGEGARFTITVPPGAYRSAGR